MCQWWYISAPALGALQKCCGKEKSCTHQEPKNSIWGKKINGRYELNRAGILWQHKSLYWCGSPRLGGHSEGLMALFAPRTERLLGKLMQQLLLWTFLPIRAIPSAARALHPRVLLGISNLGPVLSLQLKFFFFFQAENTKRCNKNVSSQTVIFSAPQIGPIHLPSWQWWLYWTLICYASRSTPPNTLMHFWKPKEYRFRHWSFYTFPQI